MTAIINYVRLSSPEDWSTTQATYAHTCGFTYAWLDPYDNTLVWHYASCPVDAVLSALGDVIAGFTASALAALTNLDAPDSDTHERMINVINDIHQMAVQWLNDKNTTAEISQFIQGDNRLRTLIVDELINQGAVSP